MRAVCPIRLLADTIRLSVDAIRKISRSIFILIYSVLCSFSTAVFLDLAVVEFLVLRVSRCEGGRMRFCERCFSCSVPAEGHICELSGTNPHRGESHKSDRTAAETHYTAKGVGLRHGLCLFLQR